MKTTTATPVPPSRPDDDAGVPEDFRVRVAGERRARMRARLVSATVDAHLARSPGDSPVIDDVIRLAGVSRGTFYKYFESLEEIVSEIGQQLGEEMLVAYQALFGGQDNPAVRVAGGPLLALSRAALEPARAAFTSRMDVIKYMAREDLHGIAVKDCLLEGRQRGVLSFDSIDAALDLAVGATVEGTRRVLHHQRFDEAYFCELAALILRGLGMTPDSARQAVDQAWRHLMTHTEALPWWREAAPAAPSSEP